MNFNDPTLLMNLREALRKFQDEEQRIVVRCYKCWGYGHSINECPNEVFVTYSEWKSSKSGTSLDNDYESDSVFNPSCDDEHDDNSYDDEYDKNLFNCDERDSCGNDNYSYDDNHSPVYDESDGEEEEFVEELFCLDKSDLVQVGDCSSNKNFVKADPVQDFSSMYMSNYKDPYLYEDPKSSDFGLRIMMDMEHVIEKECLFKRDEDGKKNIVADANPRRYTFTTLDVRLLDTNFNDYYGMDTCGEGVVNVCDGLVQSKSNDMMFPYIDPYILEEINVCSIKEEIKCEEVEFIDCLVKKELKKMKTKVCTLKSLFQLTYGGSKGKQIIVLMFVQINFPFDPGGTTIIIGDLSLHGITELRTIPFKGGGNDTNRDESFEQGKYDTRFETTTKAKLM